MRDKRLSKIITGVKKSFGTIILAFTFLFTVLYSFALVGYYFIINRLFNLESTGFSNM
jgi:hypothetical protein